MPISRERAFYAVFFLAGMPALIYQVVWQRVLKLYFGVDIYSTAVVVATFMLGLGLGSLLGGRFADRVRQPARYYALVELLLGVFGVLSLPVFSGVGKMFAGAGLSTMIAVDFLLLLVPTSLMGMTLPLMCRAVIHEDGLIGRQLSRLYAVNTLGAAVGAVLTSFLLIGLLGLDGATWLAAGANVLLAAVVLSMRGAEPGPTAAGLLREHPAAPAARAADRNMLSYGQVLLLSGMSGFVALGYEIIWYRVIGTLLHGTVYVFGSLLFFVLLGIGAGALLAKRRVDEPGAVARFGFSQLGIAAYSLLVFGVIGYLSWLPGLRHVFVASTLLSFHPAPELAVGVITPITLYSAADLIAWNLVIVFVPALLMGYGFPNLARAGSNAVARLGKSIGGIYFANIVGSTLGSLAVGFVGIEFLGTENTLRTLIVLGCGVAALALVRSEVDRIRWLWGNWSRGGAALAAVVVLAVGAAAFPGAPRILRAIHAADQRGVDFEVDEDRTGTVALRRQNAVIAFGQEKPIVDRWRLLIDGATHGSFEKGLDAFIIERELAIGMAAIRSPHRVLCIGLGDGVICGTVVAAPEVEEVIIVELNHGLRQMLAHSRQGQVIANSPKVRFVLDDGRRWLLANPQERFDLITMFPLHAAHAGSGSLYSVEFLELARSRLNPGGALYVKSADPFSSARTIAEVFPQVLRLDRSGYMAADAPLVFDAARVPAEYELADHVTATRESILEGTRGAALNYDLRPRSEYYLTYPYARYLSALLHERPKFWFTPEEARAAIRMRDELPRQ